MWRNERQGLISVYCDEREREEGGVIRGGAGGRGSGESRK